MRSTIESKSVRVTAVNQRNLEVEKTSSRYTCAVCGQRMTEEEWNANVCHGTVVVKNYRQPIHGFHSHVKCLFPHWEFGTYPMTWNAFRYHEAMPAYFKRATDKVTSKGDFIVTLEPEGKPILENYASLAEWALDVYTLFGMLPTQDGSVSCELKDLTRGNLRGMRARLENLSSRFDMTGDENGLHANVSWAGMTGADVREIRENAAVLFSDLWLEMANHPEDTISVWGRNFCTYAGNPLEGNGYTSHYTALNLMHSHGDGTARMEWRLLHFVTAEQVFYTLCFLQEVTKILHRWCDGSITTQQAAKLILKHYRRRVDGTALYMHRT